MCIEDLKRDRDRRLADLRAELEEVMEESDRLKQENGSLKLESEASLRRWEQGAKEKAEMQRQLECAYQERRQVMEERNRVEKDLASTAKNKGSLAMKAREL